MWPQWSERAPLQGAKVTRCISIESEPLMRRASESLSVFICRINSDEHDAEHGVRSGPKQPLAPEYHDKPGAPSYQQETVKK